MRANKIKGEGEGGEKKDSYIMRAAVWLMDGGAGTRTLCLFRAAVSSRGRSRLWELEASALARPGPLCSELLRAASSGLRGPVALYFSSDE